MPNSVLSSETDKVAFPFILPIIRFSEVIKKGKASMKTNGKRASLAFTQLISMAARDNN